MRIPLNFFFISRYSVAFRCYLNCTSALVPKGINMERQEGQKSTDNCTSDRTTLRMAGQPYEWSEHTLRMIGPLYEWPDNGTNDRTTVRMIGQRYEWSGDSTNGRTTGQMIVTPYEWLDNGTNDRTTVRVEWVWNMVFISLIYLASMTKVCKMVLLEIGSLPRVLSWTACALISRALVSQGSCGYKS